MIHEIEALLFVAGSEGLLLTELAQQLDCSADEALKGVKQFKEHLQQTQSALQVIKEDGHYVLTTRTEMAPLLQKYAYSALHTKLSKSALETLAIVAYKQPITRVEVDEIRGVQSSAALQKLMARQLIEVTGRVDGPGRPQLFATTPYFLEYFGLTSITDLPELTELDSEDEVESDLFFEQFNETFEED